MSRYCASIIFVLFFTGCSVKSASDFVAPTLATNSVNVHPNEADRYLLYALDAQYREDYKSASTYFEKLYHLNKNPLYIEEAIRNRILLKDYKVLKRLLDSALATYPKNNTIKRYAAAYYIDMHQYKKAQEIAENLIKSENNPKDRALLASAQLGAGETKKALRYFQDAYKKEKNAKTLLALVDIYYKLDKKERAKQLLNSHIDFIACEEILCYKLLEIYQKERDTKGLLKVAKKLYHKTGKEAFAKMVLEIYTYQKDEEGIRAFLEESHFDDSALLALYIRAKSFNKAASLAQKLYHDTKDLHFLAQMAMIEYEAAQKQQNPKMLKSVQKKFDKVIKEIDDPSYNNFYGYILIDHDIDIAKGMELIKKALKKEPNAPYYIDSLAWGYYKRGECQKAYDTIYPIMIMVKEPEITDHYKKIKACKEGKK